MHTMERLFSSFSGRPCRRRAIILVLSLAILAMLPAFPVSAGEAYEKPSFHNGMANIDQLSLASETTAHALVPPRPLATEHAAALQGLAYLRSGLLHSASWNVSHTLDKIDWSVMRSDDGWYILYQLNNGDFTWMLLDFDSRLLAFDGNILEDDPPTYTGRLPDNTDEAVESYLRRFALGCLGVEQVTDFRRLGVRTHGGYDVVMTCSARLGGEEYIFDFRLSTNRIFRLEKANAQRRTIISQREALLLSEQWLISQGDHSLTDFFRSIRWQEETRRFEGVLTWREEHLRQTTLLHITPNGMISAESSDWSMTPPEPLTASISGVLPMDAVLYDLVEGRYLVSSGYARKNTPYTLLDEMNIFSSGICPAGQWLENMLLVRCRDSKDQERVAWLSADQLENYALNASATPVPDPVLERMTVTLDGQEHVLSCYDKHLTMSSFTQPPPGSRAPEEIVAIGLKAIMEKYDLPLSDLTAEPFEYGYEAESSIPRWQIDFCSESDDLPGCGYEIFIRDSDGAVMIIFGPNDGNG